MNSFTYQRIERLIGRMQDSKTGLVLKNAMNFFTTTPTCFTGESLIEWLDYDLKIHEHVETMHVAHMISCHGYIFPINDHILTVRDDGSLYRFQTPFLWPSNIDLLEDNDYAVYLCKRTMQNKQRLKLADYEAEQLARLQKTLCKGWEFIYLQAEAQAKVDKKREKIERKVLDSQEQAFWDLHRPPPGCANVLERNYKDLKTKSKLPSSQKLQTSVRLDHLRKEISGLHCRTKRSRIKVSKAVESYVTYSHQYSPYDAFLTQPPPNSPNPWLSDNTEYWTEQENNKDICSSRIKRWSLGLQELLKDNVGREFFREFLVKEFSVENLKFWESCLELKRLPLSEVNGLLVEMYRLHLGKTSAEPVNLDGRVLESLTARIEENANDRYCLEEAQENIFVLMKRDSYVRFMKEMRILNTKNQSLQKNKKKTNSLLYRPTLKRN